MTESADRVAAVVVITGDKTGERYITLGEGDGTFQRWKLSGGASIQDQTRIKRAPRLRPCGSRRS